MTREGDCGGQIGRRMDEFTLRDSQYMVSMSVTVPTDVLLPLRSCLPIIVLLS